MALAELIAEERRKAAEAAGQPAGPVAPQEPPPAPFTDSAGLWRDMKPTILPMAGNVLGSAAGLGIGAMTGGVGAIAAPVLESLGGMGGEYLNQK